MADIFFWAGVYLLTMLLGYALKRRGLFHPEDKRFLSNLIFYVTLPAMLVSSFEDERVDGWFLAALAAGLAAESLMLLAASLASRRRPPVIQALYAVNCVGLNLGNITTPFLRNFFPQGVPYLCMFDAADAFLTLGNTYTVACKRLGRQTGPLLRGIFSSLAHSVPFVTYAVMTALSLLRITLPAPVLLAADFLGCGNGFLAMLLVGISLEFRLDRQAIREVCRILAVRYACGAAAAAALFYLLPAPLVMRQVLTLAVFSAVPSACLVYTQRWRSARRPSPGS